jgi:hypothetical protein
MKLKGSPKCGCRGGESVRSCSEVLSFRGLFIGIDRYQSPAIGDLSCAGRDATALNALFMDTLGGVPTLLTDAEATRHRIAVEFSALAGCDLDDTVIIGFSGHGSETHELVPYDADIAPCRRPPYRSTCSKIGFPHSGPPLGLLPRLLLLRRVRLEGPSS